MKLKNRTFLTAKKLLHMLLEHTRYGLEMETGCIFQQVHKTTTEECAIVESKDGKKYRVSVERVYDDV
jgi:hypothetical protein